MFNEFTGSRCLFILALLSKMSKKIRLRLYHVFYSKLWIFSNIDVFIENNNAQQELLTIFDSNTTCPNCDYVCKKGDEILTICSECECCFCFLCREDHDAYCCVCPNATKIKSILENLSSEFDLTDVKFCPVCRMAIEKESGCNLMECAKCKTQFCWKCLKTDSYITNSNIKHTCNDYGVFDLG